MGTFVPESPESEAHLPAHRAIEGFSLLLQGFRWPETLELEELFNPGFLVPVILRKDSGDPPVLCLIIQNVQWRTVRERDGLRAQSPWNVFQSLMLYKKPMQVPNSLQLEAFVGLTGLQVGRSSLGLAGSCAELGLG